MQQTARHKHLTMVTEKKMKRHLLLIAAAALCLAAAETASAEALPEKGIDLVEKADTLNILEGTYQDENMENHTDGQRITDKPSGKVEGTLTYKKGWIYTSDNQPILLKDAKLYFSSKECKVYKRNTTVFSRGEDIAVYGVSGGAGAALGFMAADACIDNGEPFSRTLAASAIIAVGIAVPCSIIGGTMMLKGKCRLKVLVRKYNEHYLFQNP